MEYLNDLRSDLACETVNARGQGIRGASYSQAKSMGFSVERLCIRTASAERETGKPRGEYCTVHCDSMYLLAQQKERALCRLLASLLTSTAQQLTGKCIDGEFSLLAVGLGNRELTADAVGPLTLSHLTPTRHLKTYEKELYRSIGAASVTLLSPGVMGQTGMETLEVVGGAVKAVRPQLVLLIDALVARDCERLASTVQLSNVGVCPGAGVGNHRSALTAESLGVPVMTLGVPTVVRSSSLVLSALQPKSVEEKESFLRNVRAGGEDFFVTPKDCDAIVQGSARLLSSAIELAFFDLLPALPSIF